MMEYLILTPVASTIFVVTIITSLFALNNDELKEKLMLHPYAIMHRKTNYFTIISSGFIHADIMHLFFNMFTFYFFAFILEQLLGHWQFAVLYILSMILADIPSILKHKNNWGYRSLGASGAISGVLFSMILFAPFMQIGIFPLPPQYGIWAIVFGPLYLLYCYYMARQANDNVNHDAHFFGAIAGVALTIVLSPGVLSIFLSQVSAKLGGG